MSDYFVQFPDMTGCRVDTSVDEARVGNEICARMASIHFGL